MVEKSIWFVLRFIETVLDFQQKQALHYWEDCADNWTRGYDRIRNTIRDFEPIKKYSIPKR